MGDSKCGDGKVQNHYTYKDQNILHKLNQGISRTEESNKEQSL